MTKKLRRVLGSLFLVASVLVTQIPTNGATTSEAADFQMNGTTLVKYTGTAEAVSVPDGVTVIGEEAFANNTYMTEVSMPNSLLKINYNAFTDCENLKSLDLNDDLLEIGAGAFNNCSNLTTVSFGPSLEKLGTGVFTGCSSLEKVTIASNNKKFSYGNGVIYNKDKTVVYEMLSGNTETSYQMPDTVKEIKAYSFFGCNNLTTINLSDNLTEIPDYAFANCKYLTTVTIPYSVKKINQGAFSGCEKLGDLTIPESVTNIHATAFDGCYNVNMMATEGTYAAEYAANWLITNAAEIEAQDAKDLQTSADTTGQETSNDTSGTDSTDTVQSSTDAATTTDTSGNLLGQTYIVNKNAVVFINNTQQTVHSYDNGNLDSSSATDTAGNNDSANNETGDGTSVDNNTSTDATKEVSTVDQTIQDAMNGLVGTNATLKGVYIPKYAIVNNQIVDYGFYGNKSLTDYTIPETITKLNDFSFARTNLTSITIPEGVTSIGYGCFYHCDNLSDIVIPSTVTEIETAAFQFTPYMDNWKNDTSKSDFLVVGDGILIGYKGTNAKVSIPENVKKIASEVFMNHNEITTLVFPDSLLSIGEDAFANCTQLKTIIGGSYLTSIKDRAFANTAIATIRIPTDVTTIGLQAYSEITANLPEGTDFQSVLFYGDEIPTYSYEKTATRFSNSEYRTSLFQGVTLALVNESVDLTSLDSDNVLLNEDFGFQGLIGTITLETTPTQIGVIEVRLCTEPGYESGEMTLPETATIFSEEYTLNYDHMKYETDTIQQVTAVSEGTNPVSVENLSSLFPAGEYIQGTIQGATLPLFVTIQETSESDVAIRSAYEAVYGALNDTIDMITFDISVKDEHNAIPIVKFGNDSMVLKLPISSDMAAGYVHVITIDEDGQLEDLPCDVTKDGEINVVSFSINHCSPYAIYINNSFGNVTTSDTSGLTYLSSQKDQSPDTGENGEIAKWLGALGLFSVGIILILYRKKPLYTKEITGISR